MAAFFKNESGQSCAPMVRVRCSASRGGAARARRSQRKTAGRFASHEDWDGKNSRAFLRAYDTFVSRGAFVCSEKLHFLNDDVQRGTLHRADIHMRRVHGDAELPDEMSRGVGKLRADPHGARIREDHALRLPVVERRAALERQQGRTDCIRESPLHWSTVRILEIQSEGRSGRGPCLRYAIKKVIGLLKLHNWP